MDTISVEELKGRLDAGEELVILDVREPHEHQQFNIGGILLPLGQIQILMLEEIEDFKDREIILYCRSGNRSGQACLILESLGYARPRNLSGGMLKWQESYGTAF